MTQSFFREDFTIEDEGKAQLEKPESREHGFRDRNLLGISMPKLCLADATAEHRHGIRAWDLADDSPGAGTLHQRLELAPGGVVEIAHDRVVSPKLWPR